MMNKLVKLLIAVILGTGLVAGQCFEANCHQDLQQRRLLHSPVEDEDCSACHNSTGKKHPKGRGAEYPLAFSSVGELCLDCHDVDPEQENIHGALSVGECTDCHDPHGSQLNYLIKFSSIQELCVSCHDDEFGSQKFEHGPSAAGACNVCHQSHGDQTQSLLSYKEVNQLCFSCHEFKQEEIQGYPFKHKAVTEKCTSCHDPHESNVASLLHASAPDLCIDCHSTKAPTDAAKQSVHKPMSQDQTCLNCHNSHGGQFESLLQADTYSLCMNCHDRPMTIGKKKLPNMKQFLEKKKNVHGPILQKDCSGCHDPHQSANISLLKYEYPKSFYSVFNKSNYDLCFQCHPPDNMLNETSTNTTNFRNGDVNLHFLHVNQKKGRTCRACHQTHASDNSSHIRQSVPFGGWELPLNYIKTEAGGSCAPGCHRSVSYKR